MVELSPVAGRPVRPLPIGAFPLPFGYLLLPDGSDTTAARDALLAGRLPDLWPATLRGHELALAGDFDGAMNAFAGEDVVDRFNRLVISPDTHHGDLPADLDAIRADLGADQAVLVDLVLFVQGRSNEAPDPELLEGELAALALAGHAALAVEAGELDAAISLLARGIAAAQRTYPALAGVMYGACGQIQHQVGQMDDAIASLKAGLALLAETDLVVGCAELHLELASAYHEQAGDRREQLARAVHHYHCVLQTINETNAPSLYAAAHAGVAAAYLTMPMTEASDQLRLGVAVGSLRAALTVYTPETHPREWSSAQLNLANALVYAPSTHQADNLVEAVELYEAVLVSRHRDDDPLGFARVLANQGNALAHLGMFDHARGKLVESRFIFEEFHEYEAVTSVRGILDEIARQKALTGADV